MLGLSLLMCVSSLHFRDSPSWEQYYIVLYSTVILPAGNRESIFSDCEIAMAGVLGPTYSNFHVYTSSMNCSS